MFGVKEIFGYLHMSLSKPAEANVSPEGWKRLQNTSL